MFRISMKGRNIGALIGAAILCTGAGFAAVGATTPSSPTPVTEIPSMIPDNGVSLYHRHIVLMPLTTPNESFISAARAITDADAYVNPNPGTAVLALVTVPASIPPAGFTQPSDPIASVPAWVVTLTLPAPANVNLSGRGGPLWVTHDEVVVNAETGKFVVGFFTP